jgi:hypothetical protein
MPDLVQLLQSQDLGHLQIVAELWGIDPKPNDMGAGAENTARAMSDTQLAVEIIEALEPNARAALGALLQSSGRLPWAIFVRQFGEVREMGAGRRDREQPHLHPASAAEVLYYRALLGRAFFDTESGPQEFAYIPDDLLHVIRGGATEPAAVETPVGRRAAAPEHTHVSTATDRILDDATTFLAALRIDGAVPADPVLRGSLEAAGILELGLPHPQRVKAFLESPRAEALGMLVDGWRQSSTFNELRLVPGLICEGPWVNQPRSARQFILRQLESIPRGTWWSLPAFIGDIKQKHADFQRPAGDYDSWFIKSAADGSYLRGFSSWESVDGALIRFMFTDVMHRLGLLELGSPGTDAQPSAFRLPEEQANPTSAAEDGKLHIGSQGRIAASRGVPRAVRYQLARFCQWDDDKADEYRYHATPSSLTRARAQGLKVEHLLTLLAKHSEAGIPPALVKALKRWEANGTEARAETQVVLRVTKPKILEELRRSKAAKYLGEPLGPTSVVVKGGAIQKVAEAMTEMGLLLEDRAERST